MLFRAFCCLCSNRQSAPNRNRDNRHFDTDNWDDEGFASTKARARVVELSKLKRDAIDVTTDVIIAENLLRRHGEDSSLLMYHGKCDREMHQALDKIPVTSHGALVKKPYYYHHYNHKSCGNGNGERCTSDIV